MAKALISHLILSTHTLLNTQTCQCEPVNVRPKAESCTTIALFIMTYNTESIYILKHHFFSGNIVDIYNIIKLSILYPPLLCFLNDDHNRLKTASNYTAHFLYAWNNWMFYYCYKNVQYIKQQLVPVLEFDWLISARRVPVQQWCITLLASVCAFQKRLSVYSRQCVC